MVKCDADMLKKIVIICIANLADIVQINGLLCIFNIF